MLLTQIHQFWPSGTCLACTLRKQLHWFRTRASLTCYFLCNRVHKQMFSEKNKAKHTILSFTSTIPLPIWRGKKFHRCEIAYCLPKYNKSWWFSVESNHDELFFINTFKCFIFVFLFLYLSSNLKKPIHKTAVHLLLYEASCWVLLFSYGLVKLFRIMRQNKHHKSLVFISQALFHSLETESFWLWMINGLRKCWGLKWLCFEQCC